MPILIDTDSAEAKERRQWEQYPSAYGPPGNPYRFRPFPAMLYRAQQIPAGFPGAGKWVTGMDRPSKFHFRSTDEWGAACEAVESFARGCQIVVNDEAEYKRARADGWCDSPKEAEAAAIEEQNRISTAAAERAYADRNMGEKAKAEAAEYEAENFGHHPEIPVQPKRRGRKPAEA
jgi:hypothetical protein